LNQSTREGRGTLVYEKRRGVMEKGKRGGKEFSGRKQRGKGRNARETHNKK